MEFGSPLLGRICQEAACSSYTVALAPPKRKLAKFYQDLGSCLWALGPYLSPGHLEITISVCVGKPHCASVFFDLCTFFDF